MPDVTRLVSRSVSMLKRLGMDDHEALLTVLTVAEVVRARMAAEGLFDIQWVLAVNRNVIDRLAAFHRPVTEYAGDEYGDRTSSGTGGTDSAG